MKRKIVRLPSVAAFVAGCFFMPHLWVSCDLLGTNSEKTGELRIAFSADQSEITRTDSGMPDTCDFILTVTDSKGKVLYGGPFGACPESLLVPEGSYVVSAVSGEFSKPAFSAPQYGDEQCVVVPRGGVADVRLVCRQVNAGVRLRIAPEFLDVYPQGVLFLKSDDGKLMYGYKEKRIAYFNPGNVSLMLSDGGVDKVLMSRTLMAQEILTLGVGAASADSPGQGASSGISVSVDTSRNWISDNYVIGGKPGGGSGPSNALTVQQALASVGDEDVWVCGYVVGGDLTSASASFGAPFASKTNLLLGPRSGTSSKASCLSVQLPDGEVREALNLVDNPGLWGKKIFVKGDIVAAYYGIPGLKNTDEYERP